MLQTIYIKNFAIIDQLNVSFHEGMTVLTGETGAGKSIIIDALALLAGGRASSEMIRHDSQKAVLQAQFDISSLETVQHFLEIEGLLSDDYQLVLTREIHRTGKSQVRINGFLANVSILKMLGTLLLDIHGQHEHQFLMEEAKHLLLLDQYDAQAIQNLRADYTQTYQHYSETKRQLKQLMLNEQNDTQRVNLLKRHVADIEEVNPHMDEDKQLEIELRQLNNEWKVANVLLQLDGALANDEVGVREQIYRSLSGVEQITELSPDYENISVTLNDILALVNDLSKQVGKSLDQIEFDEVRLLEVEQRLEQLDKLKERYGQNINEVLVYYQTIKQELDYILNKDKHLGDVQQQFLSVRERLLEQGKALREQRMLMAKQLEKEVKKQLVDLHMEKIDFKVAFKPLDSKPKIKANGLDEVEFLVATNVGEPLKPLVKVASGGEMSRMMLALKAIFASQQNMSTIVFDEIDTGVSGRVAQAIANKMHDIAQKIQVLCISHLPQVAARSDYHLFVKKVVENDRTRAVLDTLSDEQRRFEVARMFAGDNITDSALQHAEELLKQQ